jgi:hypothetical protein
MVYLSFMKRNIKDRAVNSRGNAVAKGIDLLMDIIPVDGFKSWAAVTLLYKQGFRGTYPEWCQQLNWYDRNGNPMKSMVSKSIRTAKQRGFIPKDATLASYKRSW